jgi:DNA-binding transcriptional ArsR family regulator
LQVALGTSQANISRQLKVLHEAGLLSRERRGAQVFYAISEPLVMDICEAACRKLNREAVLAPAPRMAFAS